jgi:hypothetical protein
MEAMSLRLWTVLNRVIRNFATFLICLTVYSGVVHAADSLTGVVLLDSSGEGPNRVGTIRLATTKETYDLEYIEPLKRQFANETCWDIGAFWSVEVQVVDSSREITSVTCTGKLDEVAHGSWLAVRSYLQSIARGSSPSPSLFSSRWRASREFEEYGFKAKGLDASDLRFHGRPGRCVAVIQLQTGRAQLRADECFLKVSGKYVSLTFDVIRNSRTAQWEIDNIKIN